MSHRRLAATAAVFAASVALMSGPAYAADPSGAPHGAKPAGTPPISVDLPGAKTFTSPADKAFRAQRVTTTTATAQTGGAMKSRVTPTGKTIYTTSYCYSGQGGDGTAANPFCRPQDAVDAAVPGDVVKILGSQGYSSWTPLTVRTSGITLVGDGIQAWISPTNADGGKPALVLDGVSDVTVSNLMLTTYNNNAVQIKNSSNITLDAGYIASHGGYDALSIDGTSHDVTVTRSVLATSTWSANASGVSIASGAKAITLAGNVLAASGITATDVVGLTVTGNTVQRGCTPALVVGGTSSDVVVENNLFEDANPTTDASQGGYKSVCGDAGWAPDVTVSAESAAATTADYNAFYVYGDDATAPYGWAGTTYNTLPDFRTGVPGQGVHDLVDTRKANSASPRPNTTTPADFLLQKGSLSIGSANPSARGALTSDFYGVTPHTSRGAEEPNNLGLAVSLTGKQSNAHGISLAMGVKTGGVSSSMVLQWGDGQTEFPYVSGDGTINLTHHYTKAGTYTVTATLTDNRGNSEVNTLSVTTAGSDYTAYGPTRLLDTRQGLGAPQQKIAPFSSIRLKVGGNGAIPANVTAVVLNVTAVNAEKSGFITAYPDGGARPTTSNVNYVAGRIVPNQVVVPVGDGGYVDFYSGSYGSVDLVADVSGYFTQTASSEYTPVVPSRLVDTRTGVGTAKGKLRGLTSFSTPIAGRTAGSATLPSSGITAVALNVTVTGPTASGVLTAYPDGLDKPPVASNLNYVAGQVVANSVIVPVGADGQVRFYSGSYGDTDVVVDVVGYYSDTTAGAYLPVDPERLLDTRDASWSYGPLAAGDYIYMPLSTTHPDITSFVLNTTVTRTTGGGFLTVSPDPNQLYQYQNGYPSWPTRPDASTLNWKKGETVPNLAQASAGNNGILDFWNTGNGNIDLIVDIFGYYQTS